VGPRSQREAKPSWVGEGGVLRPCIRFARKLDACDSDDRPRSPSWAGCTSSAAIAVQLACCLRRSPDAHEIPSYMTTRSGSGRRGWAGTVGEGEGRHAGELRPCMRPLPREQGRGRRGPCSSPHARPAVSRAVLSWCLSSAVRHLHRRLRGERG
jgi:hypothetical protein